MTKKNSLKLALACAALASLSAKAQSTVAYDNSTGFQNLFTSRGNNEIADEVYLSNGSGVTITHFEFEYTFVNNGGGSAPTAKVRLYDATGGNINVGNFILGSDSETFSLATDGTGTTTSRRVGFDLNVNDADGKIIWSVDFDGLLGSDTAGLRFYDGVGEGTAAGQSLDDHWENTGSVAVPNWALVNNTDIVGAGFPNAGSQVIDNFGAVITIVPEPGTIALFVGGAAVLGLAARRRKS